MAMLDVIGKVEDEELKSELTKEFESAKKEINSKAEAEREKLSNQLATEKKSVETLTSTLEAKEKELLSKGDEAQVNARIKELEAESLDYKNKYDSLNEAHTTLKTNLQQAEAQKIARKYLEPHNAHEHEFIVEDMAKGLVQSTENPDNWFYVNAKEEYIPVETRATELMEGKYKALQVAKGADKGGTGANGDNGNTDNSGLPKTREDYMKLDIEKRNELQTSNLDHIRSILTA